MPRFSGCREQRCITTPAGNKSHNPYGESSCIFFGAAQAQLIPQLQELELSSLRTEERLPNSDRKPEVLISRWLRCNAIHMVRSNGSAVERH
ncbi:MAG: hypothetical protein KME31_04265 [Tolypothrix carrinoi HA7290-LM1]|jgi:hypothetical protein|nr:hypothetical protein [Tolypothrix carrinoi HA7290-LM1]